ncbi:MAG: putative cation efflux system [Acidimicrobiia bacterium]|nr:putative cation efflux system [Acidimicrobiia bacterium]
MAANAQHVDAAPTVAPESARTVVIALLANLAIALAKLIAAALTMSSALLAEGFHAIADSGNEVLLLVAQRRSRQPPDEEHPLGYGREAYFWALIAAVAVFVGGALLSLRQGIEELVHPTETSSFIVGYVVLVVSFVFEGLSLRQAFGQLRKEASQLGRSFGRHLVLTSDPTTRAVVAEDTAALVGNAVAIAGLAVTQATGSHVADALAAIGIGLILGYVAQRLAKRNLDFLVGEQAPPSIKTQIAALILGQEGVGAISELLVTFVGPRQVWVVCRVDIDDALAGDAVERLVRETERLLIDATAVVIRADIVTVGRTI